MKREDSGQNDARPVDPVFLQELAESVQYLDVPNGS